VVEFCHLKVHQLPQTNTLGVLLKGIRSVILLKMAGKICKENHYNHLRSNNYDACTSAALCILNI
jgi:hypothetical protein